MRIQKSIYNLIRSSDIITIFGHVNPDDDCYGSQVGLRDSLRQTFPHKQIYALGSGSSRLLDYVGKMDVIDDETIKKSLAIIVDVGDRERIEDQRFSIAKKMIKIDHHIFTEAFADYEWIDTMYVAASEMIADFVIFNHMRMPLSAARALFAGISADSGRFQYAPTSERTFRLAAELIEIGANPSELYDLIYVYNPQFVRFKSEVVANYQTNGVVAYLVIDQPFLLARNLKSGDAYGLVNGIANMDGFPIWISFVEREDGIVNCEIRAKKVNIQPVASAFGGGGHEQAAGCRLDSIKRIPDVLAALNRAAKGDDDNV
ncbi:MAG TPA: bifunctional oligoribonuclease/PAP phosphatase NrnA [Bacilli bacterium]|nr:bifunctional oligoribonuclease/PAP phosphatase NrnA [Bacilli bacterium]